VQGEIDRKIHYSNMQIKDFSFYNKKDSLWNEPQRLHPKKFAPYSVQSNDFRKNVTDLTKINEDLKKQAFEKSWNKIHKLKHED